MDLEHYDLVVIGAGISGIAAAKFYLDIHPNCKLAILEKDHSVGGVWNSARIFDTFYTQSPLGTWEYSDMSMPKPPEEDIHNGVFKAKHTARYLENYINQRVYAGISLRERISFDFDVQSVTKKADEWTVSGIHSEHVRSLKTPKLIVASGLTSIPNMPRLPGHEKFGNPIMHQKGFGQSGILESPTINNITVLGAGKSSADMVYDCVKAGKTVTWVIRATGTGPAFFVSVNSKLSPSTIYQISTIRVIATLSPSIFNADSWWNRFLQRTQMGRNQVTKFFDGLHKSVVEAPKFDGRGPEAEKRGFQELKPHTPVFWQNQAAGLINRPDFWDTIAEKVQVYHADIEILKTGIIRLKDGETVESDAILCGTGWVPSLDFFDQDMLAELGIPQPLEDYPPEEAKKWDALEKDADQEVLKRFPILANPPEHYHNPVTHTPYHLFNGIAPLNDPSIAFVGHVLVANYFRVAECQAIWATAYLDGNFNLPPLEERQREVALMVAWCRRRYLSNGDRGHWMSADQTGYTDNLFRQLGLSSHRGFWLWDSFLPSRMKDLQGLRGEYIAKFGQDTKGASDNDSMASTSNTALVR
ncbi:MAG: hypothetical protein Q9170_002113 [Blastenia crenularia]